MLTTLLETADRRRDHVAVLSDEAQGERAVTYGELLGGSAALAGRILDVAGTADLDGARVALLAEPGAGWIEAAWAIWRAGGHAVPLALSHPEPELEHVLTDSGASIIVAQPDLRDRIESLAERLGLPILSLDVSDSSTDRPLPLSLPNPVAADFGERFALLLYTSGTTGRPKGVPIRHRHLEAQIRSLSEAWRWSEDDHIVGVLPLHHVHGIVNVLLSALWHGATCGLHRRFDAVRVWSSFGDERSTPTRSPTLFMGVPTLYRRLIEEWRARPELQEKRTRAASHLRLMVSGSAALPETTLDAWREICGQTLLERYGMTEIGMALSQLYDGRRIPGTVGGPLPGVEVRVRQDELQVRGSGVFDGYWRRPDDTAEAFTEDGWFRTGDVARRVVDAEGVVYRLLGRRSVDILKSGGEKISALEIEAELRLHEAVADAAVVGLPDPEWGQKVVACVEKAPDRAVSDKRLVDELDRLCRQRLAAYKVPKRIEVVAQLPRNALGKVVKGNLLAVLE